MNSTPEFTGTAKITSELHAALVQSAQFLPMVKEYVIDGPETAVVVNADLQKIKVKKKWFDDSRKSITKPIRDAEEATNSFFRPFIESLQAAEDHCKRLLLDYDAKLEAQRQEEIRQQEEAARKARQEQEAKTAAERARAEEQAAQKRREAEEAEAARQKALAEGNARAAAAAAAAGAKAQEQAQAIITNAEENIAASEATIPTQAAAPATEAPALRGFSSRSVWKAVINDKQALIRAAATDRQAAALLIVDQAAANKLANALKSALNIPGLKAIEERIAASRAA